jgi:tetratricopeptide (TPR) repeat protein
MFKRISLLFCWVLLLNSFIANSQCTQKATGNKKIANNYMTFGQFSCALEEYLVIYQTKPDKVFVNRGLAECYAGIPGLEKNAIKHVKFLVKKKKNSPQDLWILALAYHKNEQFAKAIETANRYITEYKPAETELENVQILISNCENAIELYKFPRKINFENLGKKINTQWDELNPMTSDNEGMLIFTTSRKTVMGGYSFGNAFLPDLFISKLKGTKYSKPRSLGSTFNSIDIDEYAGSSADSKYLFIATDSEGFQIFNLKMSHKGPRGRSFPKPINLIGINNNNSNER